MSKLPDYSFTDKEIVFVVGYGNLPANCVLKDEHSMIVLSVLVNTKTNIILDATVNTINSLSISFITAQMIGKNLIKDADEIIEELSRYQAPAQRSLIVAFKATIDRYVNYVRGLPKND